MIDAINDFIDTKNEINTYFDFLEKVNDKSKGTPHIYYPLNLTVPGYQIKEDISKILKANAFLMLYNLVEATIKNGIWELLVKVESERIPYKNLKTELKNIWLDRKVQIEFKTKDETIVKQLYTVVENVLNGDLTFFRDKQQIKFESGNLHIDTIQKTSKKYGFNIVNISHNDEKEAFKKVKKERNYLAHGDTTFSNCGNSCDFADLKKYKDYIFTYLGKVLDSIEEFIANEDYLITP